ncbi:MAG: phenylacetate-CoA oxygenase subunit PaaI [Alphaproteobacteria bacterium]|nr:MAG: phenylacetate-CoA oxygenase subunit PaaI [Alphaproteobacteria bacterium]
MDKALFEFCLRMGDNTLILGHRVSEWCGHAPVVEEDIALANTALDLIGQTQLWLGLAGEIEGKGRDADALAFRRDAWEMRSVLLVEQPNGDFGQTLMRQYLFDQWQALMLAALEESAEPRIAAIARKARKEVAYHLERSRGTVVGLGDGTEESHARMQAALDRLYPYVGELFSDDAIDSALAERGIAPLPSSLRPDYDAALAETMAEATLSLPENRWSHSGGRDGSRHSEHLGHILAEMQWLQRAYPDATW